MEQAHRADSSTGTALRQRAAVGARRLIAIGGGKGGIGKSVVSTLLAVELAGRGNSVVLVDCDLGGPNLHSLLAMSFPRRTLSDFILRRAPTLAELAVATPVPRLELISGARNAIGTASPLHQQKLRLMRALRGLSADVVVLDLGAGSHTAVVDFFLLADQGVVMVVPQPTAVENAYRFLKAAFLRSLRDPESNELLKQVAAEASLERDGRAVTPAELLAAVSARDPDLGSRMRARVSSFRPLLLVNQAREPEDSMLADAIGAAAERLFGIGVRPLGALHHCPQVDRIVRGRLPLVLDHIGRELSGDVVRATDRLLADQNWDAPA